MRHTFLRLINDRIRRRDVNRPLAGLVFLLGSAQSNWVSTFPLAAKVVVAVTAKLAIPKGHRAVMRRVRVSVEKRPPRRARKGGGVVRSVVEGGTPWERVERR